MSQEPREKVELFPNYTFICFRSFEVDPHSDQIKPFNFYILIFRDGLLTVCDLSVEGGINSIVKRNDCSSTLDDPIFWPKYAQERISSRPT